MTQIKVINSVIVQVHILDVVLTILFLCLVYSAFVEDFSSDDPLYPAMLSCTLPCSSHAATRVLESARHVPEIR